MPTLTEFYASAKSAYESVLLESPDRCNIYNVTYAPDSAGGTTAVDGAAVASNVPVLYEETKYQSAQVAGGALANVTHSLFFADSSIARGIKPNYAIVTLPRGNNPSRRFENPIVLEGSMEVGVKVAAALKL